MEISPIAGIRVMPAMKSRPVDPELPAVFDIEPETRPDDDTFTRNGKQAAGAEENDEEPSSGEEEKAPEQTASPAEQASSQISFFA